MGGSVEFKGENLLDMDPEERSHGGIFMSFQSPIEIPGVSNIDFLQMACNARRKKRGLPELSPIEVNLWVTDFFLSIFTQMIYFWYFFAVFWVLAA